jgi:hypothetical protein
MKLTTIIFGATAIVCAILMVLMMLSIKALRQLLG